MTTRHFVTRLHPDDRVDPGRAGPQVMRHVTVNVAESPLAWLAARGMVSDAHRGGACRAGTGRHLLAGDLCGRGDRRRRKGAGVAIAIGQAGFDAGA